MNTLADTGKKISNYPNFIPPSSKSYFLQHNGNEVLQVKVVDQPGDLAKGFSGIREEQVEDHQGLFFWFKETSPKSFWMPDTYFDLAIIYLGQDLKVLELVRDAPHHIGYSEKVEPIYRAPLVKSRYVLEIKASSPLAKIINKGDQFRWVKDHPHSKQK